MSKLVLPPRWFPLLLVLASAPALAEPEPVRGVLFHAPDCAECGELFDFLLPALFEQTGEGLQLAAFDTTKPPGAELYQAANPAAAGLPLLLVGHSMGGTGVLDLVDALQTGREPMLAARKALQATELIFATYESSRKRGRVDLPLEIEDSPLLSMIESREIAITG